MSTQPHRKNAARSIRVNQPKKAWTWSSTALMHSAKPVNPISHHKSMQASISPLMTIMMAALLAGIWIARP